MIKIVFISQKFTREILDLREINRKEKRANKTSIKIMFFLVFKVNIAITLVSRLLYR